MNKGTTSSSRLICATTPRLSAFPGTNHRLIAARGAWENPMA
ncbi:MAG: hypothetical protein VB124_04110 [Burkholderia sp.]